MEIVHRDIEAYAKRVTTPEPELLRRLEQETRDSMPFPEMLTGRVEGRLLKMLAGLCGARRVLEIGMFTGYSALSLAEALPPDGEVITCEIDPGAVRFARRYFESSPHGKKIRIEEGPALATLPKLKGAFDMVFIDADKENYPGYFSAGFDLVRHGGLIAVDNALRSGRVLAPEDPGTLAIAALNAKVVEDARMESVLLTVRDGLLLVRKLAD